MVEKQSFIRSKSNRDLLQGKVKGSVIDWALHNTGKYWKACNIIITLDSEWMCGFNAYKYIVLHRGLIIDG